MSAQIKEPLGTELEQVTNAVTTMNRVEAARKAQEAQAARIASERKELDDAKAAEAKRLADEEAMRVDQERAAKDAAKAKRGRNTTPTRDAILSALSYHFQKDKATVEGWLKILFGTTS